jgi:bifunctional non-homologous end joining protein LigD
MILDFIDGPACAGLFPEGDSMGSPRTASIRYEAMLLGRRREPFDHPDWLFELKYDGFRALLSIGTARPEFVSRKAYAFARFANLALFIDRELDANAVLDGEVVCFDREGRPRFYDLMFGRGDPAFVVFDILVLRAAIFESCR